METDLTLLEDFELEEIIVGSGDSVTLFGIAVLWLEGNWRKGPLNLYISYDVLQHWLYLEENLCSHDILNAIAEFLSSDTDEPYIINNQQLGDISPIVLSVSFVLHSMQSMSPDEELISGSFSSDGDDEDLKYPESFIVKEAVSLNRNHLPKWNNALELVFGKTLEPLKNLHLNMQKAENLMAKGYKRQQSLSMLHLDFPYIIHFTDLIDIFSKKDVKDIINETSNEEEELPF